MTKKFLSMLLVILMILQIASPVLANVVEETLEEVPLQEESVLATDTVEGTITDSDDTLPDDEDETDNDASLSAGNASTSGITDTTNSGVVSTDNVGQITETADEFRIIGEDLLRRTEYQKVFITDKGLMVASVYDYPVHKEDEDGLWEDIDNTLYLDETGGQAVWKNTNGSFNVSFPQYINPSTTEISTSSLSGDKSLSWSYEGSNITEGTVVNDNVPLLGNDAYLTLEDRVSHIIYEDVYDGVDVEYYVTTKGIKENFIIKNAQAQKEFLINYNIGGMFFDAIDSQSIGIYSDEAKTDLVYTINAPDMSDALGVASDGVSINALSHTNSILQVKISTDEEWMSDKMRVYPVKVDPWVNTTRSNSYVDDTFISSSHPSTKYYEGVTLRVGQSSDYGWCRSLLNFDMPTLLKGDTVVYAELSLRKNAAGTSSMQVNAYPITVNSENAAAHTTHPERGWDPQKVTWANMNTCYDEDSLIDYINVTSSGATFEYLILTEIIKKWYDGTHPQHGIMLVSALDSKNGSTSAANKYTSFYSTNGSVVSYYPIMQIHFLNNKGLENYWSYHSHSAGNAGVGYVNDYTGNLVFEAPVTTMTGELVPISTTLYYNGYMSGMEYRNGKKGAEVGKGWTANILQKIDSLSVEGVTDEEEEKFRLMFNRDDDKKYFYLFTDADGTEHFFRLPPGTTSGQTFYEEDGLNIKLVRDGDSTDERYTLKYPDGSKLAFNTNGRLTKVYDKNGNNATFTYDGSNIASIKDGADRMTNFTYVGGTDPNKIKTIKTQISATEYEEVSLNYNTDGYLDKITYPDGNKTTFTYTNGLLSEVKNDDGSRIVYGYASASGLCDTEKSRVLSVTEYGADIQNVYTSSMGSSIDYSYNNDNTTTFTYDINGTDVRELASFDSFGRTTSIVNLEDYSATDLSYTTVSESQQSSGKYGSANKIANVTQTGGTVHNLLMDSSFENETSGWSASGSTSESSTTAAYIGHKSRKLTMYHR